MSVTKTIIKNDDTYAIKYTYPQADDGSIRVEHKGTYTMGQMDSIISGLQTKIDEWTDNKTKCEEIE